MLKKTKVKNPAEKVTEKQIEKVLLACMSGVNDAGYVYHPSPEFFNSVRGMNEDDVLFALDALESRSLITRLIADIPGCNNIE